MSNGEAIMKVTDVSTSQVSLHNASHNDSLTPIDSTPIDSMGVLATDIVTPTAVPLDHQRVTSTISVRSSHAKKQFDDLPSTNSSQQFPLSYDVGESTGNIKQAPTQQSIHENSISSHQRSQQQILLDNLNTSNILRFRGSSGANGARTPGLVSLHSAIAEGCEEVCKVANDKPLYSIVSLVMYKDVLGYAGLDESHVLVCGQSAPMGIAGDEGDAASFRFQSRRQQCQQRLNNNGASNKNGGKGRLNSAIMRVAYDDDHDIIGGNICLKQAKYFSNDSYNNTMEFSVNNNGGTLNGTEEGENVVAGAAEGDGDPSNIDDEKQGHEEIKKVEAWHHNDKLPRSLRASMHRETMVDFGSTLVARFVGCTGQNFESQQEILSIGDNNDVCGSDPNERTPLHGDGSNKVAQCNNNTSASSVMPQRQLSVLYPKDAHENPNDFISDVMSHFNDLYITPPPAHDRLHQKYGEEQSNEISADEEGIVGGNSSVNRRKNGSFHTTPIVNVIFTPHDNFSVRKAKEALAFLWPDVTPTVWAAKLDFSCIAMILAVGAACTHVIQSASHHPLTDNILSNISPNRSGFAQNSYSQPPQQHEALLIADVIQQPGDGTFIHINAGTFDSLQVFRMESHPAAVHNLGSPKEGLSLYNILRNKANSQLGKALLREWLKMPICDAQVLKQRHDLVSLFSAPDVMRELVPRLSRLLKGVQQPEFVIHRIRLERHSAQDYKTVVQAATSMVELCRVLRPYYRCRALVSPDYTEQGMNSDPYSNARSRYSQFAFPAVDRLIEACHFETAMELINRITTTVDIASIPSFGSYYNNNNGEGNIGGKRGRRGTREEALSRTTGQSNQKMQPSTQRSTGLKATILKGFNPQLDELRACYGSLDFDAFLTTAAQRELESLPSEFQRWKVRVAFMPHIGYMVATDIADMIVPYNSPSLLQQPSGPHSSIQQLPFIPSPSSSGGSFPSGTVQCNPANITFGATTTLQPSPQSGSYFTHSNSGFAGMMYPSNDISSMAAAPVTPSNIDGLDLITGGDASGSGHSPTNGSASDAYTDYLHNTSGTAATTSSLQLPKTWEVLFKTDSTCFSKTPQTKELDESVGDLHAAIAELTTSILRVLNKDILRLSHCLTAIRNTAEIDALLAIAQASVEEGWTRPQFYKNNNCVDNSRVMMSDGTEVRRNVPKTASGLVLVNAFHPLLSRCSEYPVIPFSIQLGDVDHYNHVNNPNHHYYNTQSQSPLTPYTHDGQCQNIGNNDALHERGDGRQLNGSNITEAEQSPSPTAPSLKEPLPSNPRLLILTGPHGSGKSVCQRAIGLITIMAHIGCFVPAEYALLPQYVDHILAIDSSTSTTLMSGMNTLPVTSAMRGGGRFGVSQFAPGIGRSVTGSRNEESHIARSHQFSSQSPISMSSGLGGYEGACITPSGRQQGCSSGGEIKSAFGKEVAAVCRAMWCSTGNSLLLVDEFGKGTLAADGVALLASVIEDLHDRQLEFQRPVAVFTTHYTELFEKNLVNKKAVNWSCMKVALVNHDDGSMELGKSQISYQHSSPMNGKTRVMGVPSGYSPSVCSTSLFGGIGKMDGSPYPRHGSSVYNTNGVQVFGAKPPSWNASAGTPSFPPSFASSYNYDFNTPHPQLGVMRRFQVPNQNVMRQGYSGVQLPSSYTSPYGQYVPHFSTRQRGLRNDNGGTSARATYGNSSAGPWPLSGSKSDGRYSQYMGQYGTQYQREGDSPFASFLSSSSWAGGGGRDSTCGGSDTYHGEGIENGRDCSPELIFLFELEKCNLSKMMKCALETARLAGVPPVILDRALQVLSSITSSNQPDSESNSPYIPTIINNDISCDANDDYFGNNQTRATEEISTCEVIDDSGQEAAIVCSPQIAENVFENKDIVAPLISHELVQNESRENLDTAAVNVSCCDEISNPPDQSQYINSNPTDPVYDGPQGSDYEAASQNPGSRLSQSLPLIHDMGAAETPIRPFVPPISQVTENNSTSTAEQQLKPQFRERKDSICSGDSYPRVQTRRDTRPLLHPSLSPSYSSQSSQYQSLQPLQYFNFHSEQHCANDNTGSYQSNSFKISNHNNIAGPMTIASHCPKVVECNIATSADYYSDSDVTEHSQRFQLTCLESQ